RKLFLPHREEVWTYRSESFRVAEVPEPFAVVGVPLCDLQAVWYLDQVFVDDELYRSRRAQSLLVGMSCEPAPECRCDGHLMPVAGDIFIGQERIWALSSAGKDLLQACGCLDSAEMPLPWPEDMQGKRPEITEKEYRHALDSDIWGEEAKRCFSCGACSVVCPTCYCFDMLDEVALDGSAIRKRTWDNCFFAEHGKVAGDYDFRPGRANRLRFRMEHKFFGFGTLHGQNSCVGCGRCRKACPVDIDLDDIAERLIKEGV
ncbi:MAG: 4Fe-4S dicluster domain-containing protein, partial [Desulfuromonadales bacterium]|nr:4Fe-4S dicluster domain-containing protein [Desulfuromonadales bacterium]